MRSTRAIGATATLLAVLAATGCGGGSSDDAASSASTHTTRAGIASGEPAPPQTSTSTSPSSTTTSPTAKPTPSSSDTAAGAPGVPEPARQHTKAGAKAFVAHYLDVMNRAAQKPTPEPLAPLSLNTCKTCKEWAEVFTTLINDNTHYDRPVFETPKSVRALEVNSKKFHLFFTLKQSAANIRSSSSGSITDSGSASSMRVVFELTWTNTGWRVFEVQKNA